MSRCAVRVLVWYAVIFNAILQRNFTEVEGNNYSMVSGNKLNIAIFLHLQVYNKKPSSAFHILPLFMRYFPCLRHSSHYGLCHYLKECNTMPMFTTFLGKRSQSPEFPKPHVTSNVTGFENMQKLGFKSAYIALLTSSCYWTVATMLSTSQHQGN